MKKHLNHRAFLILIVIISSGFAAFYLFDADPLAKDDSQELDRLFRDMLVLKIPHVTEPADIRLKDIEGRQVNLADFRGKIVFLNFWTTWCPTCRIEMPSMEKLHQKFKYKDFAMVTINLQEAASQVKEFFKVHKLTFTALLDSTGDVGTAFGIYQIPTTFILDKEGRIIAKAVGPREWDSKNAIALFEHLTDKYVAISNLTSAH
ncbi:MAG: TlpA family protein disulfide reductase [Desulfobacterales bacterium]|nr:MAG: TlpA family protein disulfide reductase [Desulfobacterales bacterium]